MIDLRPEEVYAALTYFYDHHDAMVAEMKRFVGDRRSKSSITTVFAGRIVAPQGRAGEIICCRSSPSSVAENSLVRGDAAC